MSNVQRKAKAIRLLILDVDGVLTSGLIYYGNQGAELKSFHVHDGLGVKLLQQTGVKVAVISAKKSGLVAERLKEIKVEHVYLGYEDKLGPYEELKQILQLTDEEIAYMGDDLPDLPLLKRAGLAITVPNGVEIIKQHVDYVTDSKPGKGAVREACEFIMKAQNSFENVLQSYLTK